jgi:hypothetical protein
MIKTNIYSIRLTDEQRAKLNTKAQDMNMKPSELLRTQIFKLLDYSYETRLPHHSGHRKSKG